MAPNHLFPAKGKINITCNRRVYIIYNPQRTVAHVGNTPRAQNGLCQRLNEQLKGKSSICRIYLGPLELSVRQGFTFRYLEVKSLALGCSFRLWVSAHLSAANWIASSKLINHYHRQDFPTMVLHVNQQEHILN
jgi:hypothetical protein